MDLADTCTNAVVIGALPQLPPGQIGRNCANDIFRYIFVNEKFCVLITKFLTWVTDKYGDDVASTQEASLTIVKYSSLNPVLMAVITPPLHNYTQYIMAICVNPQSPCVPRVYNEHVLNKMLASSDKVCTTIIMTGCNVQTNEYGLLEMYYVVKPPICKFEYRKTGTIPMKR